MGKRGVVEKTESIKDIDNIEMIEDVEELEGFLLSTPRGIID